MSVTCVESVVFKNAPMGIAEIDTLSGEIRSVNEEYCRILGRTSGSLIGRSWKDYTPGDEVLLDSVIIARLLEKKALPVTLYKHYIRPDGTLVAVKIVLASVDRANGTASHVAMVVKVPSMPVNGDSRFAFGKNIQMARNALINSLVSLAKFRDRETGGHLLRTKSYVYLLLDLTSDEFPLSRYGKQLVASASMLHDIGKVGIPDSLLLKNGPLTPDEIVVMKTHPLLGAMTIKESLRCTDYDVSLMFARDIVAFHHERWDGTGYPYGLKGVNIPYIARVMAVADVYDALRSDRPYKCAFTHEESVRIIRDESGSHFDPFLVRTFLAHERLFDAISISGKDSGLSA